MKSGKSKVLTAFVVLLMVLDVVALIFVFRSPGNHVGETSPGELVVSHTRPPNPFISATDTPSSSDAEEEVPEGPPPFSYEIYNIGDTFTMGTFEQDNDKDNGPEPIEWKVIDKSDKGIFVISVYALDAVQYYWENTKYKYTTWEQSLIRASLNDEYYNGCFTDEERAYIALTHNVNDDNVDFGTEGGNDTDDYLFFLSHEEVYKYFPENADRKVVATAYAKKQGAFNESKHTYWWLRSPGKFRCNAEYVFASGVVYSYGSDVGHSDVCSRPAMWVNFLPEG